MITKKTTTSICFLILILFLSLQWLVSGQNAVLNCNDSKDEKQCKKKIAFDQLMERSKSVSNSLESSDPQVTLKSKQEQLVIIKDLTKWSKKFKVKLQQVSVSEGIKMEDGKIRPFNQCASVMEKGELICLANYSYLDHSSNTCVYQCLLKREVD